MPNINLPSSINSSQWNTQVSKVKNAPTTGKVAENLKALETEHKSVNWKLLEIDKLKAPADMLKRIDELKAARKGVDSLKSATDKVLKGVDDFVKAAGKDFDKTVLKTAQSIKSQANGFGADVASQFDAAIKELEGKAKNAPAAKTAGPAVKTSAQKADDKLLMKLSKKAVAAAMKPKPGVPPPMFAIVGTKPGKAKVLMGTKSEISKLIGKFGKKDPATNKKPPVVKDPKSQVLFENGVLVFVSSRIPSKFLACAKRAMKPQINKSPKVKWRKPGEPDIEAAGGGDEMKADDVQVQDEAVDPREQAAAKAEFAKLMDTVKKTMPTAIKAKSAEDQGDIKEAIELAAKAASKGDYVEALGQVEAAQNMLDDAPEDDSEGDVDDGEDATSESSPPAAKSAAGAAASQGAAAAGAAASQGAAAGAAAGQGAAAKTAQAGAGAAAGGFAGVQDTWRKATEDAAKQIEVLHGKISEMFPAGTQNLDTALKTLTQVKSAMSSATLDSQLKMVAGAKDAAAREKAVAAARKTVADLKKIIEGHPVVQQLDDNEVHKITAAKTIKEGLSQLESVLR